MSSYATLEADSELVDIADAKALPPVDPVALPVADATDARQWRWTYEGETSAWFFSRDAAIVDFQETHPGVGIG
jgi:hypothetical protein